MSRARTFLAIGLVGVALLAVGCRKKAPQTPPPTPPPAPVTVAPPERAPAPPPVVDEVPDPFDKDLEELNIYVREQGLLGDVYFDFDKFELRPDARERLTKNAEFMQAHPNFRFLVEGHCDERGTNEYNLALGESRSNAATAYLVSLNVDGGRMRTVSYGEERPVCTASEESCWWRNRRARFVITAK